MRTELMTIVKQLQETESEDYKSFQKMVLESTHLQGVNPSTRHQKFLADLLEDCYHRMCLERGRNKLLTKKVESFIERYDSVSK